MSKAILVTDMPRSCAECKLSCISPEETEISCCGLVISLKDEVKCADDYYMSRPDWCPLKEVPEKMNVCGKYPQKDGITPSYKLGYNACIEDILKEGD